MLRRQTKTQDLLKKRGQRAKKPGVPLILGGSGELNKQKFSLNLLSGKNTEIHADKQTFYR